MIQNIIVNLEQKSNLLIKLVQILMSSKTITGQTANECYPEAKKVKSFYQQLKKNHKDALSHSYQQSM